jgi:hypothetical protein
MTTPAAPLPSLCPDGAGSSRPLRIISGGQSGVDRAALDVALALGLPCGGFCPAGRWAEDGPIAARYPLIETPSADPAQRTEWNVRDADATLILCRRLPLSGGTAHTAETAAALGRPCRVVLLGSADPGEVRAWIAGRVLNIAGPRESEDPGIYQAARTLLEALLESGSR